MNLYIQSEVERQLRGLHSLEHIVYAYVPKDKQDHYIHIIHDAMVLRARWAKAMEKEDENG